MNRVRTFIHTFSDVTATARIDLCENDVIGPMRVEWHPMLSSREQILRIKDEYTRWMLDNYTRIARDTQKKLIYADTFGGGRAWIVPPSGEVVQVMDNGVRIQP